MGRSLHTGSHRMHGDEVYPAQREEQSSVRLSSRTTNLEQPGRKPGAARLSHFMAAPSGPVLSGTGSQSSPEVSLLSSL